jgi:structural maintenance of chromosome 1
MDQIKIQQEQAKQTMDKESKLRAKLGELDEAKLEYQDSQLKLEKELEKYKVEYEKLAEATSKLSKQRETSQKALVELESMLEMLYAERLSIIRKCKLEEVALPMLNGQIFTETDFELFQVS